MYTVCGACNERIHGYLLLFLQSLKFAPFYLLDFTQKSAIPMWLGADPLLLGSLFLCVLLSESFGSQKEAAKVR